MIVIRPAALALTWFLSSAALAQQSETIEVRITNLDVVVTDRSGNPITGLTKDDFEILEGGKPQTITNFSELRETSGAPAAATPASEIIPAAKRCGEWLCQDRHHHAVGGWRTNRAGASAEPER